MPVLVDLAALIAAAGITDDIRLAIDGELGIFSLSAITDSGIDLIHCAGTAADKRAIVREFSVGCRYAVNAAGTTRAYLYRYCAAFHEVDETRDNTAAATAGAAATLNII